MSDSGLQAIFLASRHKLLRFLHAHGAGEAAEDLIQDLWIRISTTATGPIDQPLAYLYRAANNLMLDRYRSIQQAVKRDGQWTTAATGGSDRSEEPVGERPMIASEQLGMIDAALDALGERAATVFRRHRIDGVPQKVIARELNLSLSTIESDLRKAYRAVLDLRRRLDEV